MGNPKLVERGAKFQLQAARAQNAADEAVVRPALKIYGPPAVTAAKRALCGLGYIDATTNAVVRAKEQVTPRSSGKPKSTKEQITEENLVLVTSLGARTWENAPAGTMRQLLETVDPQVYSSANLRLCGREHAKE